MKDINLTINDDKLTVETKTINRQTKNYYRFVLNGGNGGKYVLHLKTLLRDEFYPFINGVCVLPDEFTNVETLTVNVYCRSNGQQIVTNTVQIKEV